MNLDDLETKARAATKGPWSVHDASWTDVDQVLGIEAPSASVIGCRATDGPGADLLIAKPDAAYIASMSPDVALKLIAVARAAKAWAESDECDKFLPNKRREQEILAALAALGDES